jgi:hypothetical protein
MQALSPDVYRSRSHEIMTDRLLQLYHRADACQTFEGCFWYPRTTDLIQHLAVEVRQPWQRLAEVFAALSPNTSWQRNLEGGFRMARAFAAGEAMLLPGVTTITRNARFAWHLLQGTPFDALFKVAPKVRAFRANLWGDLQPVTVDRHMVRASGYVPGRKDGDGISPVEYGRIAAAFVEAAGAVGLAPARFQAVIWCVVRGNGE